MMDDAQAEYIARIERDAEDEQRAYEDEQRMDAFIASLTPVSEYRLPMADHE